MKTTIVTNTTTMTTTRFTPPLTTTIRSDEEFLTTNATMDNKPYVFQSNFSRNNDSVFVSLRSNTSDTNVFINNTFLNHNYSCEIIFDEHSNTIIETKILINFNGLFTRDLAVQFGDRLLDIFELLSTIRSIKNQNMTEGTV